MENRFRYAEASSKLPGDYAELPRPSQLGDLLFALQGLGIGVGAIILLAALAYLDSSLNGRPPPGCF